MQEIPCKPPKFKVGDKVKIIDAKFCKYIPLPELKKLGEQIIGTTGTINEFFQGKPAIVDDDGTLRNFGTASFYHVTLDNPSINLKNEFITNIPLGDSELEELESN